MTSTPTSNNHRIIINRQASCSNPTTSRALIQPIVQCLPKTIEGARSRYHTYYSSFANRYVEARSEIDRLWRKAEVKMLKLRKKAPLFYEQKLPKIVNQACSQLMTYDLAKTEPKQKFHETHRKLLHVLDGLLDCQPTGEVDFQLECDRIEQRDSLRRQYSQLKKELAEFEQTEFDIDQLGEDDDEYNRIIEAQTAKENELKRVSLLLVKIDGEDPDAIYKFKFRDIRSESCLKLLDRQDIQFMEQEFGKYLKNKKKGDFIEEGDPYIKQIVASLDLDPIEFNYEKVQLLEKHIFEAYREARRAIDQELRNDYHNQLMNEEHLLPREGLILHGPDDLPAEKIQELIREDNKANIKLEEMLESYSKQAPETEEGEVVSDDDESGDQFKNHHDIAELTKQHQHLYARVKEEPRDDYLQEEDAYSDESDSDNVPNIENGANGVVNGVKGQPFVEGEVPIKSAKRQLDDNDSPDTKRAATLSKTLNRPYRENNNDTKFVMTEKLSNHTKKSNESASDEEELEYLGIVPPSAKIECISID